MIISPKADMRVTMPDTVRVVVGCGVGCDVGDVCDVGVGARAAQNDAALTTLPASPQIVDSS